jgi:hypothetical protein
MAAASPGPNRIARFPRRENRKTLPAKGLRAIRPHGCFLVKADDFKLPLTMTTKRFAFGANPPGSGGVSTGALGQSRPATN